MQWGMQYAVDTQYTVGTQYAVGMQYTVGVSAKSQLTQWTWYIWVVGTVTFSAKRSNPMQWVRSTQ